jgi:hypothetical protein
VARTATWHALPRGTHSAHTLRLLLRLLLHLLRLLPWSGICPSSACCCHPSRRLIAGTFLSSQHFIQLLEFFSRADVPDPTWGNHHNVFRQVVRFINFISGTLPRQSALQFHFRNLSATICAASARRTHTSLSGSSGGSSSSGGAGESPSQPACLPARLPVSQ